jgi:hypothetical protein
MTTDELTKEQVLLLTECYVAAMGLCGATELNVAQLDSIRQLMAAQGAESCTKLNSWLRALAEEKKALCSS